VVRPAGGPFDRDHPVTDPLSTLRDALSGTYRVEREIGQGGMATVFLATDLKHGRPVAIKVLRPELAASLGHDRFLREIEIAARLQHPHILPVYDSGEAGNILYYVMPFVEGESLRDRLVRGGPLSPAEAVRLAREVADALDYAHRQGLVHRDIKPANILISQGNAVVADFGIARAVSASAATGPGLTQAGMAVGTPSYMSPEQALGDQNLDGRTDIYALGVVLYEMLKGAPPYEGTTPQSIIVQALSGKPPELPADPLLLQPVIARAMAREPKDRFATAGELRTALDTLGSGTRHVATQPASRRRGLLIAGALAVLATLAVVFLPGRFRGQENPRQSLIVFPFENKTGDPSREFLSEAAMNLLGLSAAHWSDMRVHDDERTASLLRRRNVGSAGDLDFEEARAMAREASVGTLVLGDIRREGDSLAIEAKVHDVRSGNRIATHIVRAPWTADPRPLFDRLASMILGTSGAPPGERPSVLSQTTTSIEAYRAYLDGASALQRFDIDSARKALERAIALDSSFALAYIRLRDAEGWNAGAFRGDPERRKEHIRAAERHSASLPPRFKSLVAYHRAYEDGDFRRARRIAEEMITRDSTDVEAWYQLGEAHYHGGGFTFPHADTLGNLGKALRAFQRALALDSSYILAYRHIIDALGNCNGLGVLCGPDSAVYAPPDTLRARFGVETLERIRRDGRAAQIETARGWVTTLPNALPPRIALIFALYTQQRYDEALTEIDAASRLGEASVAGVMKGQIFFLRGKPGEAAEIIDSAIRGARDTASAINNMGNAIAPAVIMAGAGRLAKAERLVSVVFRALPVDSLPGPSNVMFSKADIERFIHAYLATESSGPKAAASIREVNQILQTRAKGDTALLRRMATSNGLASLAAYLATRDTALLPGFLRIADTTGSSTWRVVDALLALARGDTARARMRVDRHYRTPSESEFNGEQGLARSYGWGTVLAELGEARLAIDAFARIDSSDARIQRPGLLVRSYAERGELYQQLGDMQKAVEYYDKFIAAWENADAELQPQVERVRKARAAAKGEVWPERRR
jgi:serine/threonine-protein kinase